MTSIGTGPQGILEVKPHLLFASIPYEQHISNQNHPASVTRKACHIALCLSLAPNPLCIHNMISDAFFETEWAPYMLICHCDTDFEDLSQKEVPDAADE